jgi:hypothetical protein
MFLLFGRPTFSGGILGVRREPTVAGAKHRCLGEKLRNLADCHRQPPLPLSPRVRTLSAILQTGTGLPKARGGNPVGHPWSGRHGQSSGSPLLFGAEILELRPRCRKPALEDADDPVANLGRRERGSVYEATPSINLIFGTDDHLIGIAIHSGEALGLLDPLHQVIDGHGLVSTDGPAVEFTSSRRIAVLQLSRKVQDTKARLVLEGRYPHAQWRRGLALQRGDGRAAPERTLRSPGELLITVPCSKPLISPVPARPGCRRNDRNPPPCCNLGGRYGLLTALLHAGTKGSQTPCWREMDSNFRFRAR